MTMAERIKELRLSAGLTQEELGERLGLQKSAIAKYENGRVENIKQGTIKAMADLFSVRPSYIMGWDDHPSAPVFEAAAGEGRVTEWYANDSINLQLEADESYVTVVGRSMEPTLLDGDHVIVCAQSIPDYPHQICLVKINGDEATLKRVEIKEHGILLIGDNIDVYPPHFFTDTEVNDLPVEIKGVVTKLIRDIK